VATIPHAPVQLAGVRVLQATAATGAILRAVEAILLSDIVWATVIVRII
jgi:hypothetical protein